jgi:hypothetical protein
LFVFRLAKGRNVIELLYKPVLWNKSYFKESYALKIPADYHSLVFRDQGPFDFVEVTSEPAYTELRHLFPIPCGYLEWDAGNDATSLATLIEFFWSALPLLSWAVRKGGKQLNVLLNADQDCLHLDVLRSAQQLSTSCSSYRYSESVIQLIKEAEWPLVHPECSCGCGGFRLSDYSRPKPTLERSVHVAAETQRDQEDAEAYRARVRSEEEVQHALAKLDVRKKGQTKHPYHRGGKPGGRGGANAPRNPF